MLGNQLRALRRGELDLTQAELASRLGLTARTISEYENRKDPVPVMLGLAVQNLIDLKRVLRAKLEAATTIPSPYPAKLESHAVKIIPS